MNAKHLLAARLCAEHELTGDAIAKRVGISATTLDEWKTCEEFKDEVTRIEDEYKELVLSSGYARREERILMYKGILSDLDTITEERAEHAEKDAALKRVPGSKTGRIVKRLKAIGSGPLARVVEEYEVDHSTIKEQRATAQQLAQELGQWIDRKDVQSGDKPIKAYTGFDPEDV